MESDDRNLTPNLTKGNISSSQISKISDASDHSRGSYVGSNRVFIPSLNIQEGVINKNIEEKNRIEEEKKVQREKDKNNPRFQMKKMKNDKKNLKNLIKNDDFKNNASFD